MWRQFRIWAIETRPACADFRQPRFNPSRLERQKGLMIACRSLPNVTFVGNQPAIGTSENRSRLLEAFLSIMTSSRSMPVMTTWVWAR